MPRPDTEKLWAVLRGPDDVARMDNDSLASLIGGAVGDGIKKGWETCCIRLSFALNHSGQQVQGISSIKYGTQGIRVFTGRDKKDLYIIGTYEMKAYLTAKFGTPRSFLASATEDDVSDMPGILMFGWRHVDVWNGSECARLPLFGSSPGLYWWERTQVTKQSGPSR